MAKKQDRSKGFVILLDDNNIYDEEVFDTVEEAQKYIEMEFEDDFIDVVETVKICKIEIVMIAEIKPSLRIYSWNKKGE